MLREYCQKPDEENGSHGKAADGQRTSRDGLGSWQNSLSDDEKASVHRNRNENPKTEDCMNELDVFYKIMEKRWRWETKTRPEIIRCVDLSVKVLTIGLVFDSFVRMIEAWMF